MGAMLALQAATRQAREATGLFIGVRAQAGKFRVGIVTMVKNREVFNPLSDYAPLKDTLETLKQLKGTK
jgi:hypothetical protein